MPFTEICQHLAAPQIIEGSECEEKHDANEDLKEQMRKFKVAGPKKLGQNISSMELTTTFDETMVESESGIKNPDSINGSLFIDSSPGGANHFTLCRNSNTDVSLKPSTDNHSLSLQTPCDDNFLFKKSILNCNSNQLTAKTDVVTTESCSPTLIKGILRKSNLWKMRSEIRKSVSFVDENGSRPISTECIIAVPPNNLRRPIRRSRSFPTACLKSSPTVNSLPHSNDMILIFVLVIDLVSKQYELTSLQFKNNVPIQLGSLLKLIRKATTHKPLKSQRHAGFCRPSDGREMINSLTVQDNSVEENEILIAIPKGFSGSECANLSKPILEDDGFNRVVKTLRQQKRRRTKKGLLKAERSAERKRNGGRSKERHSFWTSNFFIVFPLLLIIWAFLSILQHNKEKIFPSNAIGFQKLLNTLVDDIDADLRVI